MTSKIAYCGLDCSDCEAYQATQANDEAWKARIAGQWAQQFNFPVWEAPNFLHIRTGSAGEPG